MIEGQVDQQNATLADELGKSIEQAEPSASGKGTRKVLGRRERSSRTDTLLQSYVELEKRLSRSIPLPNQDDPETVQRVFSALGRPDAPEDYIINSDEIGVSPDPEVNKALHEAGLTQSQVELVYRLGRRAFAPCSRSSRARSCRGPKSCTTREPIWRAERWGQVSSQLKEWAETRFSSDALDAIASSVDGVIALYEMMRSQEPDMLGQAGDEPNAISETDLQRMWRTHATGAIAIQTLLRVSQRLCKALS